MYQTFYIPWSGTHTKRILVAHSASTNEFHAFLSKKISQTPAIQLFHLFGHRKRTNNHKNNKSARIATVIARFRPLVAILSPFTNLRLPLLRVEFVNGHSSSGILNLDVNNQQIFWTSSITTMLVKISRAGKITHRTVLSTLYWYSQESIRQSSQTRCFTATHLPERFVSINKRTKHTV